MESTPAPPGYAPRLTASRLHAARTVLRFSLDLAFTARDAVGSSCGPRTQAQILSRHERDYIIFHCIILSQNRCVFFLKLVNIWTAISTQASLLAYVTIIHLEDYILLAIVFLCLLYFIHYEHGMICHSQSNQ